MRWITAHRAVDGKQSWSAAATGFKNRCPRLSHLQPSPAQVGVDNELQKPSAKAICLQHDCTLQRLERLFLRSEVFLLRNVAFSLRDAKVCPVFSASCPEPGLAGNKKDDSVPGAAEERGSGSKMHVFVPGWKFRCKVTLRLTCPPLVRFKMRSTAHEDLPGNRSTLSRRRCEGVFYLRRVRILV